jgi:hypothetical protein
LPLSSQDKGRQIGWKKWQKFKKNIKKVDGWLDRLFLLRRDIHQDCELIDATKGEFRFKRKFATCDPRDYRIEVGKTFI